MIRTYSTINATIKAKIYIKIQKRRHKMRRKETDIKSQVRKITQLVIVTI